MSTDLDARARAAAAALREALADVEPPMLPGGRRRRSRGPVLAAAAVVLVAGLVGVALVARDGGDQATIVAGPGGVPRLVADPVPDGLVLSATQELPATDVPSNEVRLRLYGAPDGDDPFGGGDVGIMTIGPPTAELPVYDGEETTVRGTRAVLGTPASNGGFHTLAWLEPEVGLGQVISRTLSGDRLRDVAESLVVDDGGLRVPDTVLPEGFRPVGESVPHVGIGYTGLLLPATDGYVAVYRGGRDPGRYLTVSSLAADEDALLVLRWYLADVRDVEIGGRPGVLGTVPVPGAEPGVVVGWLRSQGAMATVTASGYAADRVRAVAGSVREVDAAEWARLSEAIDPFAADQPVGPVVAQGELEGVDWRLSLQDESFCFDYVAAGGNSTSSCVGMAGPAGAAPEVATIAPPQVASGGAGPVFVYGQVGRDVPLVEVELADGGVYAAQVEDVGQEVRYYVAGLPSGSAAPVLVRALDDRRVVLATEPVTDR